MRAAFLCYLTQAWTADRYRDAPAGAPRRARHARPSPRAPRTRGLPAVAARRLRAVLGGAPPMTSLPPPRHATVHDIPHSARGGDPHARGSG